MKTNLLNWASLGWDRFQKLSNQIAQQELGLRFEDFLKRGNKQDGIDGISTVLNDDGKYTVIQCKDEDLAPAKITDLVNEFKEGKFFGKTSHFILATTSDMQKERRQERLQQVREELKNAKIDFECWDGNFFEEKLKSQYTLVAYYFSQNAAKEYCLSKRNPPKSFEDLGVTFIPRRIEKLEENQSFSDWYLSGSRDLTLKDLLIQERIDFPKICLIADPYQGKSLLLKQTAYELTQLENPFVPILIELKSYNLQPIDELLHLQEGAWLSTPLADLVVLIDGLDEVPTDKFSEAVNYINAFAHNYPNLTIIFSCRKIFYYHYELSTKIEDHFNTYELKNITDEDIAKYLHQHLRTAHKPFMEEVRQLEIDGLLSEPFYLRELVQSFLDSHGKLPSSKSAILNLFIKKSISQSGGRKLSKGNDLAHKQAVYIKAVQKLSFLLQVLDRNALQKTEMQILFSDSELEVLQHSALITVHNDSWAFTSAQFQEFLAARILSKLPFEQVMALATVGTSIIKIKSKWIKTITTMLAFFDSKDPLRESYLRFIENDNIELLFETDRSKYDETLRLNIVQKLVNRTKEKRMRTMNIGESKVGDFVGSDDLSIDYLLEVVQDDDTFDIVKVLCYKTLASTKPDILAINKIVEACLKEIPKTEDCHLAECSVQLLTYFKKFNTEIAAVLVSKRSIPNEHIYRSAVYIYLVSAKLVEPFYNYGIEGIDPLKSYNKEINHVGAENPLLAFLLNVTTRRQVQSLLLLTRSEGWFSLFEYDLEGRGKFMTSLFNKSVSIYECENEIFDDFIEYFQNLSLREQLEMAKCFSVFLELTNTSAKAVTLLSTKILANQGHGYAAILTDATLPIIVKEFGQGNYSPSSIWNCYYGLEKAGKIELAQKFKIIYEKLRESEPKSENNLPDEYVELEKQKKENDILYFNSKEKFKEGLKAIFASFTTGEVPVDSLYIDIKDLDIRKRVSSNLMYSLIRSCAGNNDHIILKDCIAFLDNKELYDFFITKQILRNSDFKKDEIYRSFIESYYYRGLEKANFENCYFQIGGQKMYKCTEVLLTKIFAETNLDTEAQYLIQMLWADKSGANALIKRSEFSISKPTLTEVIVEKINDIGLLREEIAHHMDVGISDNQIFNTHAALCAHFHLTEYRGIILDRMHRSSEYDIPDLSRIYLQLGGTSAKLIPFMEQYFGHEYVFLNIVDQVIKDYPEITEKYLQRCLVELSDNSPKTGAALRLSSLGNTDGFAYLVDQMKATGKSPFDIKGRFNIEKIETSTALELISDIAFNILEDDRGSFHDSIKSVLLEWLFCLAGKSETDLVQVCNFFSEQAQKFQDHPNVGYFNWYAERCIEHFRETALTISDIETAKVLFSNVESKLTDF